MKKPLLLALLAAPLAVALAPARAEALPPITNQLGAKGQLVLDQLSGFRLGTDRALNYYGPLGFSTYSVKETQFDPRIPIDNTTHFTTFWIAPQADIFVLDHLSVGGLVEIASTSASVETITNGTSETQPAPTTTSLTILPRVGWIFGLGDRVGLWPRLGVGYASRQTLTPDGKSTDSFSAVVVDADIALIVRITDSWFFKFAPELGFTIAGSHSVPNGTGALDSASASMFTFTGVTGFGVQLDL